MASRQELLARQDELKNAIENIEAAFKHPEDYDPQDLEWAAKSTLARMKGDLALIERRLTEDDRPSDPGPDPNEPCPGQARLAL